MAIRKKATAKRTTARKAVAKKAATKKGAARKAAPKKAAAKKGAAKKAAAPGLGPVVAPDSPATFRARVRMYRQGLGDCFLLTIPRDDAAPFQLLIDCGALDRKREFMRQVVEHIRDTVVADQGGGKARLDVVVATHEHKDHLSGFNQARGVFSDEFDFGAVWLPWTEDLSKAQIRRIKEARRKAVARLQAALASPLAAAAPDALDGVHELLGFSQDEDDTGTGRIADALEYLKLRGRDAGALQFLEPGGSPIELDGLPDVRVYVLGPPRDPILLKSSEVTDQLKRDGVIYHLSAAGEAGLDALGAALDGGAAADGDRYHPFAAQHRIAPTVPDPIDPELTRPNPYYADIEDFIRETYEHPDQQWRRIDGDWLAGLGQLALDLDNDTNNTSLVLAFEFTRTREVLLFVGDAQVGNWQSWADVTFEVPGRARPLPAHDLLERAVFYKVGHHCSHNATLRTGGLELMTRDDLVAFIPLDRATARKKGKHGWDMPAAPLYRALQERTGKRVVLSDVTAELPPEARDAGVRETGTFVDYFLE